VVTVAALALYFWMIAMTALTIVRYLVPAIGLLFALLPALALRRETVESSSLEKARA
jgi:hypothetical protein